MGGWRVVRHTKVVAAAGAQDPAKNADGPAARPFLFGLPVPDPHPRPPSAGTSSDEDDVLPEESVAEVDPAPGGDDSTHSSGAGEDDAADRPGIKSWGPAPSGRAKCIVCNASIGKTILRFEYRPSAKAPYNRLSDSCTLPLHVSRFCRRRLGRMT